MNSLRNVLNAAYSRSRGLEARIDASVSALDVASFASSKLFQAGRGYLRGFPGVFVGQRVHIAHRRHLHLGTNVVVANDVQINALSRRGVHLGDSVTVDVGAIIRGSGVVRNLGEGISVGARTAIGARNMLLGAGGIDLGQDCLLGPNVTILSENHVFADLESPIRSQGEVRIRTVIESDVWIGANSVILGGARIGKGAIVAAGAVVRGSIEPFSIVGGVPAREIGHR